MKKRWILLILPLMMALMMNAASANQWGLRGQALNIVEHTHDYDEYSCVADDYKSQTNATRVILGSRYHNQLVAVDEVKDGWKDAIFSTTAVYQPSDLDADGKFYGSDCDGAQPYHGTWSVVQTPADSNLYWRGDIPTIVFRCVNGTVYRYGVGVSESADYEVTEGDYCRSMSFITCEGGTGYVSYGVYGEGGGIITDENGKLILKELDVTDELNWGAYWEEEGNG